MGEAAFAAFSHGGEPMRLIKDSCKHECERIWFYAACNPRGRLNAA